MPTEIKCDLSGIKLMVVGALSLKQSLMSYYLKEICGCDCSITEDLDALSDLKEQNNDVVLWDVYSLNPLAIIKRLKHCVKDINCTLGLLDVSSKFGMEPMALRLKVKGFFYEGDPISKLPMGINQLHNGHVWAPREVLERCLMEETSEELISIKRSNRLTDRQEEVLRLIIKGYGNTDIAEKLQVSTNTVKAHLYQAYKKINASSRWQAAKWAESNLI